MPRRLALLVSVLLIATPISASAHSNSVESSPADGSTLDALPATATVTFNEPPTAAEVVLTLPGGKVNAVHTSVERTSVTAHLPENGPRGEYVLAYRVVSADGHPVTGTVRFTVTSGDEPSKVATDQPDEPTRIAMPLWAWLPALVVVATAAGLVVLRMRRR